jgi:hypothetical protein
MTETIDGLDALTASPFSPQECAAVQEAIKQLGELARSFLNNDGGADYRKAEDCGAKLHGLATTVLARHTAVAAFQRSRP